MFSTKNTNFYVYFELEQNESNILKRDGVSGDL